MHCRYNIISFGCWFKYKLDRNLIGGESRKAWLWCTGMSKKRLFKIAFSYRNSFQKCSAKFSTNLTLLVRSVTENSHIQLMTKVVFYVKASKSHPQVWQTEKSRIQNTYFSLMYPNLANFSTSLALRFTHFFNLGHAVKKKKRELQRKNTKRFEIKIFWNSTQWSGQPALFCLKKVVKSCFQTIVWTWWQFITGF